MVESVVLWASITWIPDNEAKYIYRFHQEYIPIREQRLQKAKELDRTQASFQMPWFKLTEFFEHLQTTFLKDFAHVTIV